MGNPKPLFLIEAAIPDTVEVFGKNKEPHQLIQELGLDELEKQFPFWCKDVGIKYCTRRGFAYNLSLKNLDLDKIHAEKNIIL